MLEIINRLQNSQNTNFSVFLLFGDIDDEVAQNFTEYILNNNYSDEPPDVLNIIINSSGGSLTAAWAIIDMMRGSHIPCRTIGLGQLASAGLFIFANGEKGMRTITNNTSIMSHQWAWGVGQQKQHELIALAKEYNHTQDRLIKNLKHVTGLDEEEILKKLLPAHDVWMSAEEAVELGLADNVSSLY